MMAPLVLRPRRPPPRRTLLGLAVALAWAQYGAALAGPGAAQVVAGQAAVSRPDPRQTVIAQGSRAAIVNWTSFSLAPGERVEFRQPDAASLILNRVTGAQPSVLDGQLTANGRVFLVNPAGVLFGRGARVEVGGLVASTLGIADADFLAGRYRFDAGRGAAGVANQGSLRAAERGTIALLGATVANDGTVSARLGTVALAAGDRISLDFGGDGLTTLQVDRGALAALVANRGMLVADGGQAVMSARAAQALAGTVLNQQGVVRAQSLVERNGRILLDGGEHGVTLASGTVDASGAAPGLRGGAVQLLGHQVGLTGHALVDARGAAGGGTVQVGGSEQGADPGVRNAAATFAGPGTRVLADATGRGDGGRVILYSREATRAFGTLSARGGPQGGDGGLVETSGKLLDVHGAAIDAQAPRGRGGRWLLDPFDVTIGPVIEGSWSNVDVSPDFSSFVSNGPSAAITGAFISQQLNQGTSVSVATGAGDGNGDINVTEPVTKSAGADATLTLNAARDINITQAITASGGGRLNIDLNADAGRSGAGAITVAAPLATNGGNLRMYGQGDPAAGRATGYAGHPDGVAASAAGISTAGLPGGSILIRGAGAGDGAGVRLVGAPLTAADGSIVIDGASSAGSGVRIEGGGSGELPPRAVLTAAGPVTITGTVGGPGGVAGVAFADAIVNLDRAGAAAGPLAVTGNGADGSGLTLRASTLNVANGALALTGRGGAAGVVLLGSTLVAGAGGALDVRGVATASLAGNGVPAGVSVSDSTLATSGGPGPITVSGQAQGAAPGLLVAGASAIGGAATSGNITLRALNGGGADMIALGGTVQSSGVLALVPGGVGSAGELTAAPAVPVDLYAPSVAPSSHFALDAAELNGAVQPGFAAVVVGSAGHVGPINVAPGADALGRNDLTLQNGGPGSAGIALAGGLANAGRQLVLSSAGPVTQGGPLVAASLLLHGAGPAASFRLADPGNSVGRLGMRYQQTAGGAGGVSFAASGDLDLVELAGTGFDAAANAPLALAGPGAQVAGPVQLQAARDLVLHDGIAAGGDITLAAGRVFDNAAGVALAPRGAWRIFAATWIGEQAGALAGSGPTPNLYNCAFGAPCASSLPPGNHFVYRQQPRLDVALDQPAPTRTYGDANPAFAYHVSGLVKQDGAAGTLAGAYASPATPSANVGSYPVSGNFSSPAGYQVAAAPGTLRVVPAALTYVADPAARFVGAPNPALGGTVTGFVAGDTLQGATSGTLAFTTPAGPGARAGRYPVLGGGLSAVNYTFGQAPANAGALLVAPLAPLPSALAAVVRPVILHDASGASSELYGHNFGLQPPCVGTGPLARPEGTDEARDLLTREWARVRDNPNLSNCIGLVRRYTCDSF